VTAATGRGVEPGDAKMALLGHGHLRDQAPGADRRVHHEILRRTQPVRTLFGELNRADDSDFRQLEQEVPSWGIARSAVW
jgi:hypothetical protein